MRTVPVGPMGHVKTRLVSSSATTLSIVLHGVIAAVSAIAGAPTTPDPTAPLTPVVEISLFEVKSSPGPFVQVFAKPKTVFEHTASREVQAAKKAFARPSRAPRAKRRSPSLSPASLRPPQKPVKSVVSGIRTETNSPLEVEFLGAAHFATPHRKFIVGAAATAASRHSVFAKRSPLVTAPGNVSRLPSPPPDMAKRLRKAYPKLSRAHRIEGEITVSLVVLASGRVAQLRATPPNRTPSLQRACLQVLQSSRWVPGLDKLGAPSAVRVRFVCEFKVGI